MRPRLLELTAFGPYAESVSVDFDALGTEGLFLIHGPTGAGKSSLLDGLTYALYGGVPGTRRPDRLRSDHADPRLATAVALEFSLHGHDYRITRVPPHERAKKAGVGMTMQKAKATLCRREGRQWSPIADGVEDVGLQIVELLGLNREQFQQVVVLPQGDFARALQADAGDRRRLLSSLFHTHRFAEYTERMLEQARAAEAAAAASTTTLQQLHDAASGRWQIINPDTDDTAPPPTLAAGAVAVLDQERAALEDAKQAESAASDALASATLAAHRHERIAAARATLAELDASADDLADARAILAAADRAAPCITFITDAQTADDEVARLSQRRATCAGVLGVLPPNLPAEVSGAVDEVLDTLGHDDDGAGAAATITTSRTTVSDVLRRIEPAAERYADWARGCERAQERAAAAAQLQEQSAAAADEAAAAAERGRSLATQRDAALAAGEQATALRDALAELDDAQAATQCLEALKERAAAVAAQVRSAKSALNTALDAHRVLLERRIANMAAELATQLASGEPCGVCGSCEHPSPARPTADLVTDAALASAEAAVQQSRVDLDRREDASAAVSAEVTAMAATAGSYADRPEELAARRGSVTTQLAEVTAVAAQRSALDRQLAACEAATASGASAATRLAAEAVAARATAEELTAATDQLGAELQTTFGTLDDPAPIVTAVRQIAATLEELWSVTVEHDSACARRSTARERLQHALEEQGFSDAEAALRAGRHRSERAQLASRLEEADRRRAAAEATLGEWAEVPDLDDDAAASLEGAQAAKQRADQQLAAAQSRLAVVRQAAEDLASLATRWEAADQESAVLTADAGRLRRLADICNGPGNAQRMSLERYVLAAYLEEIAEAASTRLRAISDGRYTLRHSDERVRGGGASGLSITILDAYTGTERDAGSLSGGETFQASLCLALAVAEVVQRHAGGVHLDTLFIDEGFGALDAEALEQAMSELDALREGGRLVGVISHVPVLRERITNAIEVHKTSGGSDVRIVLPGESGARCA